MPGQNNGFQFNGGSSLFGPSLTTIFTTRQQQAEEERRQGRCLVNHYVNPFTLPWLGENYMPALNHPAVNPLAPDNLRKTLQDAHFNRDSIDRLMGTAHHPGVNPELALVAARAKQIYENQHPGHSFEIVQGFRTKTDQQHIAALGSAYTNASGKKGHESPHQFGAAIDFHVGTRSKSGVFVPQPNDRENDQDYKDVATAMRQAAQELGYGNKLNYGALGEVHVGHGRTKHPDWGHIEEKRQFWNQWHPPGEQHPAKTGHHHQAHHKHTTTPAPGKPK